ncbi:hypothetical protein JCM3765_004687 [Sporobolomyces pararoseus]
MMDYPASYPSHCAHSDEDAMGGERDLRLTQLEEQQAEDNHSPDLLHNQIAAIEMQEMQSIESVESEELENDKSGESELEEGEILEDENDFVTMNLDGEGQETSQRDNQRRVVPAGQIPKTSPRDQDPRKYNYRQPFASSLAGQPVDSNLDEDSTIYVYRFPVPSPGLVPLLIGKSGAVVERIKEETGAEIHYVDSIQTPLSPLDSSLVTGFIQGTISSIQSALNLSKNYLQHRSRHSFDILPDPDFLNFVPSNLEVRDQQNQISNMFRQDLSCNWGKNMTVGKRNSEKAFGSQWHQKAHRSQLHHHTFTLPPASDAMIDEQENLLDDDLSTDLFIREPADRSCLPSPPCELRAYSPSAVSDHPQHSLSPSRSSRSITPPSSPEVKRRPRSSSSSPARDSLDLIRSRPRKKARSSLQEEKMEVEEALRAAAQATRPKKIKQLSFELPLVTASLFLGPASSLPHLERISRTKLKLECETLGARLIVVSGSVSEDRLAKLKTGIEDTVRSLEGYENWSIDQGGFPSSSNEPVSTDSVQQQCPSPVPVRTRNSSGAKRSRPSRKGDHGASSSPLAGNLTQALNRLKDPLSGYLPPPAQDFVSSRRSRKLSPEVEPRFAKPTPLSRCNDSDSLSPHSTLSVPSARIPQSPPPPPPSRRHQPNRSSGLPIRLARPQPQAKANSASASAYLDYRKVKKPVYKKRRL